MPDWLMYRNVIIGKISQASWWMCIWKAPTVNWQHNGSGSEEQTQHEKKGRGSKPRPFCFMTVYTIRESFGVVQHRLFSLIFGSTQ
jgi:hypothetical protein